MTMRKNATPEAKASNPTPASERLAALSAVGEATSTQHAPGTLPNVLDRARRFRDLAEAGREDPELALEAARETHIARAALEAAMTELLCKARRLRDLQALCGGGNLGPVLTRYFAEFPGKPVPNVNFSVPNPFAALATVYAEMMAEGRAPKSPL